MLIRRVSRLAQMLIIVGVLLAGGTEAQAVDPVWTAMGAVVGIEAGWKIDHMSVWHTGPVVNPAKCKTTTVGYGTDPTDPGHSLFHTVLLSAFMNKKEVQLLIDGDICVFGKPKLISVKIR